MGSGVALVGIGKIAVDQHVPAIAAFWISAHCAVFVLVRIW